MKYYTFFNTSELTIIGEYPQIEKLENYNLSSPDSYWNVLWNKFPEFEPIYGVKIRKKAIATNLLHVLPGFQGFIMDEELKELISKFKLPPHRFYSVDVIHNNKQLKYYWFHFIDSFLNHVDFEKTTFVLFQKWPFTILKEFRVSSVDELHRLEGELNFEKEIQIKQLVLLNSFPNYDIISLRNITPLILVSEVLKKSLEASKLTGFDFREYELLIT